MVIFKYTKFHVLIMGLMLGMTVLNYSGYDEDDLSGAIYSGKLERVESVINNKIGLNEKLKSTLGESFLGMAIQKADDSLDENLDDSKTRLQILELLLQNGASLDLKDALGEALLLKAVSPFVPKLPIIDLLLKYGAPIDEWVMETSKSGKGFNEISKLFSQHENLREQARANPTDDLLTWAIGYNYPYIVQLIVDTKPELVNNLDLSIATVTSPGSVKALERALQFKKFKKIAEQRNVPSELISNIAKFVKYKK